MRLRCALLYATASPSPLTLPRLTCIHINIDATIDDRFNDAQPSANAVTNMISFLHLFTPHLLELSTRLGSIYLYDDRNSFKRLIDDLRNDLRRLRIPAMWWATEVVLDDSPRIRVMHPRDVWPLDEPYTWRCRHEGHHKCLSAVFAAHFPIDDFALRKSREYWHVSVLLFVHLFFGCKH